MGAGVRHSDICSWSLKIAGRKTMVSKCFRRRAAGCGGGWSNSGHQESPCAEDGTENQGRKKALKVGCPKVECTCTGTSFLALGDVRGEREMLKSFKYSFLIDQEKVVVP